MQTPRSRVISLLLVATSAAVMAPAALARAGSDVERARAGSASGWSAVRLPPRTAPAAVACASTSWCEAVGGWRGALTAVRWTGARWNRSTAPRLPSGAVSGVLNGIVCPNQRSCVAVGAYFLRGRSPALPLIERYDGRRWRVERAAPAPLQAGFSRVNGYLNAVACPSRSLCFAVGRAVGFGAGPAPGAPVVQRWNGHQWREVQLAPATGPLDSISCLSARACTAVGAAVQFVGTPEANNLDAVYAGLTERWNGRSWQVATMPAPLGTGAALPYAVACSSATTCTAVGAAGTVLQSGGSLSTAEQALIAVWSGLAWTPQLLPYPAGAQRSPSTQSPVTSFSAIACPTSALCAAVGGYVASNGAIGPLAAIWNGTDWSQTVIRRGPVELRSVSCPALGWCMAVGGGIAERFR